MPFLSVIVPVYNAEKYLDDCFNSIKAQVFDDYEVIIVDDGSTDRSSDICDQYELNDDRVHVYHIKNSGPSNARNVAFRMATGEYIYCIDNDDFFTDIEYFSAIHDSLVMEPVDILQTGATYVQEPNFDVSKILRFDNSTNVDVNKPSRTIYDLMKIGKYETSCWTKVIKRTFLISNELFFDVGLRVEDLDWNMRFFPLIKTYAILNRSSYTHVFREGSITAAVGEKNYKNCRDQVEVISRWWKQYEPSDSEISKAALSYLSYQYCITLGRFATLEKEYQALLIDDLSKMGKILKYGNSKKQKILYMIYRMSGIKVLFKLMGFYYENLRARKRS